MFAEDIDPVSRAQWCGAASRREAVVEGLGAAAVLPILQTR